MELTVVRWPGDLVPGLQNANPTRRTPARLTFRGFFRPDRRRLGARQWQNAMRCLIRQASLLAILCQNRRRMRMTRSGSSARLKRPPRCSSGTALQREASVGWPRSKPLSLFLENENQSRCTAMCIFIATKPQCLKQPHVFGAGDSTWRTLYPDQRLCEPM